MSRCSRSRHSNMPDVHPIRASSTISFTSAGTVFGSRQIHVWRGVKSAAVLDEVQPVLEAPALHVQDVVHSDPVMLFLPPALAPFDVRFCPKSSHPTNQIS